MGYSLYVGDPHALRAQDDGGRTESARLILKCIYDKNNDLIKASFVIRAGGIFVRK